MRKLISILTTIILLCISLTACTNSLNYIKNHRPSLTGVITSVHEHSIMLNTETGPYSVALNITHPDSDTQFHAGDTVTVYFSGEVATSYPGQIFEVDAIIVEECVETMAKISGTIIAVYDKSILVEDAKTGPYTVSLNNVQHLSDSEYHIGDIVTIYHGGEVLESYPMQILSAKIIVINHCTAFPGPQT